MKNISKGKSAEVMSFVLFRVIVIWNLNFWKDFGCYLCSELGNDLCWLPSPYQAAHTYDEWTDMFYEYEAKNEGDNNVIHITTYWRAQFQRKALPHLHYTNVDNDAYSNLTFFCFMCMSNGDEFSTTYIWDECCWECVVLKKDIHLHFRFSNHQWRIVGLIELNDWNERSCYFLLLERAVF